MNNNDINKLFSAAKNGNENVAKKEATNAAEKLSQNQKEMLNKALNDKNYLNSLMSSPKAKEIMRKLGIKEEK